MVVSLVFSVPLTSCNQTRCADVLFLISRPSANKVGIYSLPTVTPTVTCICTVSRSTLVVFSRTRQQTFLFLPHVTKLGGCGGVNWKSLCLCVFCPEDLLNCLTFCNQTCIDHHELECYAFF